MSDRDDRQGRRAGEQQPVIPDGGLGSAMPSWLTERPRWAEPSTQKEPVVAKTLPKPDTSSIELSSILDVSDLPKWLQNVARRVEQRNAVAVAGPDVETVPEPVNENVVTAEPAEDGWTAVGAAQASDGVEELGPAEPAVAEELPGEIILHHEGRSQAVAVEESTPRKIVRDEDPVDAHAPAGDLPATATATHPAHEGERRVDWAAVRQEAQTTERTPLASSNPLLAKNPPKRVDPANVREQTPERNANQDHRPWWMSDTAIGVLLVAFILTMIYVVLVASGTL